jgi:trehalose-6-phosphate synthase
VNPWNIAEVAASISQALNMPADEREKMHQHNFMHVTTHTSQEWAATFVRYSPYCVAANIVESNGRKRNSSLCNFP